MKLELSRTKHSVGVAALAAAIACWGVPPAIAADFNVPAGDTAALIAAIDEANNNADCVNHIVLPAGMWSFSTIWQGAAGDRLTALPPIGGTCSGFKELELTGAGANLTVLERAASSMRVLAVTGSARISQLTVRNGFLPWELPDDPMGGAIFVDGGRLTLDNVLVYGNVAAYGGAIAARNATLSVLHSQIYLNDAGYSGGGIYIDGWYLYVVSSRIEDNAIRDRVLPPGDSPAFGGGGIAAQRILGGHCCFGPPPSKIVDSVFSNNDARGDRAGGGLALRHTAGDLFSPDGGVGGSTFSYNRASVGGGIYLFDAGFVMTIWNSTLTGNSASREGSAVYNDSPAYRPWLQSVTIASNDTPSTGSAVFSNGTSVLALSNTIVVGRDVTDPGHPSALNCKASAAGAFSSGGFNIDSDGSCGLNAAGDIYNPVPGSVLDLTPRDNGGITLTHALVPGGPAVDHGDPAGCAGVTDQRGARRVQDGNADGVARCDIGAVEMRPAMLSVAADADTYVRTDLDVRRNDNYGMQQFIQVGSGRGGDGRPFGAADQMRALLRFNLGFMPNVMLTGAVLETTLQGFDTSVLLTPFTVDAHAVLPAARRTPWIEGNGFEGPNSVNGPAGGGPKTSTDPDGACGAAWAGSSASGALDPVCHALGFGDNVDVFARNNQTQPPFASVLATQLVYPRGWFVQQPPNVTGDRFHWDVTDTAQSWLNRTLENNGLALTDVTNDDPATGPAFRSVRFGARDGQLYGLTGAVAGPRLILSWTPGTQAGDITGDSCVDLKDLAMLNAVVRKQATAGEALNLDLNHDGKVDVADARKLVTLFTHPLGAECH